MKEYDVLVVEYTEWFSTCYGIVISVADW